MNEIAQPEHPANLASSPLFVIGPKLACDEQEFFANKVKLNSNSLENLSFSILPDNNLPSPSISPNSKLLLNSRLNSNQISNQNLDSFINSNQSQDQESSISASKRPQNQDYLDFKVPTIFRNEHNKDSVEHSAPVIIPKAIEANKSKSESKRMEFKKALTKLISKAGLGAIIDKLLNSWPVLIFVNILTIWVLFADDIRTSSFGVSTDPIFDSLNLACMGVFSVEILLTTLVRKGYFLSFFFYLDVISTVSILFDVVWFQEATLLKNNASMNATQMARMGRASRIGTRAARIIRLVRLFRIVKLYKAAVYQQEVNNAKQSAANKSEDSCPLPSKDKKEPSIQLSKATNNTINANNANSNNNNPSSFKKSSIFNKERLSISNAPKQEKKASFLITEDNNPSASNPNTNLHPRLSNFSKNSQNNSLLGGPRRASRMSGAFERPRLMSRMSHKWYMNSANNSQLVSPHKSLKSPSSMHSYLGNFESLNHDTDRDNTLVDVQQEMKLKESAVGKKLSESSTKRVIIIVLLMIIIVPLFDHNFYYDTSYSFLSGMDFLSNIQDPVTGLTLLPENQIEQFCQSFIALESTNRYSQLIYLSTPYNGTSCFFYQSMNPNLIRFDSRYDLIVYLPVQGIVTATVNQSYTSYLSAIMNMVRTVFVTIVLLTATLMFSRDASELVLTPIERMIEKVHKIAENPLAIKDLHFAKETGPAINNELILIENSILKIGTLLALGFGEAGREIIASNMHKGGILDNLSRGSRKYAVYGFCDIRNFTDATEVLQEEVMVFVNNIAEIVHSIVDRCLGSANKNIGDAFLLVWKLPDSAEELLKIEEDRRKVSDICDLAVFSFLKIIGKLNRHPRILQYRTHPKLAVRFKDYRVRLGFGMHFGWAIEGAIGSSYKIDASYLSPNVNLASRLEAATKQYGVPFLFSSELYRCLSEDIQRFARKIDLVTLKGSVLPMGLYTVDVMTEDIPVSKPEASKEQVMRKRKLQKDAIITLYEQKNYSLRDLFCYDKEIKLLLRNYEAELGIREVFDDGLKAYLSGNWQLAGEKLNAFIELKGRSDSPSNVLIDFMKKNEWKCPEDWPGYRELVEK